MAGNRPHIPDPVLELKNRMKNPVYIGMCIYAHTPGLCMCGFPRKKGVCAVCGYVQFWKTFEGVCAVREGNYWGMCSFLVKKGVCAVRGYVQF